jgi:hypothetical protein
MVDGDLFNRLVDKFFSITGAVWATALAFIAHFFRIRNERLRDREAEKNDGWSHLNDLVASLSKEIGRLSDRLKAVEEENEECRKNLLAVRDELAQERADRMKFERLLQGEGDMRNQAQRIVSTEREAMKPKDQA